MNTVNQDISGIKSMRPFGVSAALCTPFSSDGSIDVARATEHATHVLGNGANSVTLFGTTGEGASLGSSERISLLDAMIGAGIGPEKIVATVCSASLHDARDQGEAFVDRGVKRLLVTPPFYFSQISEDALFTWYLAFANALGDKGLKIILYHIPQMTDVPVSCRLVRRLQSELGELIYGIKDSSGNWDSTAGLLQIENLAVLVGDERHLARASRLGAAGAISGVANLFPDRLSQVLSEGKDDAGLNLLVDDLVKLPITPAIKSLTSIVRQHADWDRVRPPLSPTPKAAISKLARHIPELMKTTVDQNAG